MTLPQPLAQHGDFKKNWHRNRQVHLMGSSTRKIKRDYHLSARWFAHTTDEIWAYSLCLRDIASINRNWTIVCKDRLEIEFSVPNEHMLILENQT